jgi:hypothetical protein
VVRKRRSKRIFPTVTLDSIRTLNRLIPYRVSESVTARSDKLAIAVLQKFFGPDWLKRHIFGSKDGFIGIDNSTAILCETRRMRRVLLAEMLYNLQIVNGFRSCLNDLAGGQIESTYAALEIGRMICTLGTDKNITFRFVAQSGILKRDYDLSIKSSDGVHIRAECDGPGCLDSFRGRIS